MRHNRPCRLGAHEQGSYFLSTSSEPCASLFACPLLLELLLNTRLRAEAACKENAPCWLRLLNPNFMQRFIFCHGIW